MRVVVFSCPKKNSHFYSFSNRGTWFVKGHGNEIEAEPLHGTTDLNMSDDEQKDARPNYL